MTNLIFQLADVQKPETLDGPFYVIECFPCPQFVTDEEGLIKSFDEYDKALQEADDCQEGYILVF